MMGRSVINGASAIFTPAFVLCARVSEITRVIRGPGENPADRPNTVPRDK